MGVKITVDGATVEVNDYSVQESSTPVAGGDSSGSVGSIGTAIQSGTISNPSWEIYPGGELYPSLSLFPSSMSAPPVPHRTLINKEITLTDTRQGYTLGRIFSVDENSDSGMDALNAVTRLGETQIRNVQAQPFVGTLGDAFEYYLGLSGITTGILVPDATLAARTVVYPGWSGELWLTLKNLCITENVEIALVSGSIILRVTGSRVARNDRNASRSVAVDAQQLARSVQVYCYFNEAITNQIIYPVAGVEPSIIQVDAGGTTVTTIPLSASLSSVVQPVASGAIPAGGTGASEYTVIGNDNIIVSPTLWTDRGGSLSVSINEDTSSIDVTVTGATNVPGVDGTALTSFRIALSDDENTYNTLFIQGSGVIQRKTLYTFPTGVTAAQTSQEIGITVDIPMITTLEQLYRVGTRTANQYTGRKISASATVTAVNRRGDTGTANYPTYDEVQATVPAMTYAAVQASAPFSGKTYDQVRAYFYASVQDTFENQVFGNVGGARFWDERSRRWYRIREATITPGGINISRADDDLKHEEIQTAYSALTYADVQTLYSGYSYNDANLMGVLNA